MTVAKLAAVMRVFLSNYYVTWGRLREFQSKVK